MWTTMLSSIAPTSKSSATDPSETYLPHYQTPLKFAPEWGIFLLGKFNDIRMLCLPSAMHYYPDFSRATAVRGFRDEIHNTPELLEELKHLGYDERRRYFPPGQMAVIIKYLGD